MGQNNKREEISYENFICDICIMIKEQHKMNINVCTGCNALTEKISGCYNITCTNMFLNPSLRKISCKLIGVEFVKQKH